MAFKVDFSRFKKLSSDKDCTVMQHEDGHTLKIAHKALSADMRKQLSKIPDAEVEKMADGGVVKLDPDKVKTFQSSSIFKPQTPSPKKMAEGGEVKSSKKTKDGLEIEEIKPEKLDYEPIAHEKVDYEPIKMADGGKVAETEPSLDQLVSAVNDFAAPAEQGRMPASDMAASLEGAGNPNQAQVDRSISSLMPQQAGTPSMMQQPSAPMPEQEVPGKEQLLNQLQSSDPNALGSYNKQLEGIAGQAASEANMHKEQADIQKAQASAAMENMAKFQQATADIDKERQSFMNDIKNQHIDPNHYVGSMTTPKKIGTAIGLILGGLGSATTGRNNALEFLNQQISNDIDAQKANLGKKESLYNAALKQYGNVQDATNMTRILQTDMAINQINEAANRSNSMAVKERARTLSGQLEGQIAPMMQMLAISRSTSGHQQPGDTGQTDQILSQLRVTNPKAAEELEKRYVPGVGVASVPVTEAKRDSLLAKSQLDSALKDLLKWSKEHEGSINPAVVNEGKAKAAEIQSMYRNAINGGVFKKGEQEFIDSIIDSDPTKFFNSFRVAPKIEAVMKENTSQLNSLRKSVGLPGYSNEENLSPQEKTMLALARKNPEHPNAKLIFKKLGIQ